jgi:hypothetical protein
MGKTSNSAFNGHEPVRRRNATVIRGGNPQHSGNSPLGKVNRIREGCSSFLHPPPFWPLDPHCLAIRHKRQFPSRRKVPASGDGARHPLDTTSGGLVTDTEIAARERAPTPVAHHELLPFGQLFPSEYEDIHCHVHLTERAANKKAAGLPAAFS